MFMNIVFGYNMRYLLVLYIYRFRCIYAYSPSIMKRVFCDATLKTIGDLTSAPETGFFVIDQRDPVDDPYMEFL